MTSNDSISIWIQGRPQSLQKRGSKENYTQRIRDAAIIAAPYPNRSKRIDIEIWFHSPSVSRADVDNIIKPVLDALIGIVYEDDRQVRSVRAVALPADDVFGIAGGFPSEIYSRLLDGEFLIRAFCGIRLRGPGPS